MRRLAMFMVLPWVLSACGNEKQDDSKKFDASQLAKYRAAIPSTAQLEATTPVRTGGSAVGDPAAYPLEAGKMALDINGAVRGIIGVMRRIVDLEPTIFNATTKEFLWGPWPNQDDFGTVAAYVRELPPGEDFKYVYALLRGVDQDVTKMKAVIWGAATPDPLNSDYGVGVTLYDFEANRLFAQANDPSFATKVFDRGRFVAVYGNGLAQDDPATQVTFVVAVFRKFIAKDDTQPNPQPVDLDYLYGRFRGSDGNALDFLDFELTGNIDEPGSGRDLAEELSVRMAFLNRGWGRAELEATGGDIQADQTVAGIECWNHLLDRQYLHMELSTTGAASVPLIPDEGAVGNCGPDVGGGNMLFEPTLDALNIPTLADVDASMLQKMEEVALNGVPSDG